MLSFAKNALGGLRGWLGGLSTSGLVSRGDEANRRQDWREAEASCRTALEGDASSPAVWVQFGHALKHLGRLAEAEAAYGRAVSLRPSYSDALLQWGHALKLLARATASTCRRVKDGEHVTMIPGTHLKEYRLAPPETAQQWLQRFRTLGPSRRMTPLLAGCAGSTQGKRRFGNSLQRAIP